MNKYILLFLCFFIGCSAFPERFPIVPQQEQYVSVIIPDADELESVTLVLRQHHAGQFDLEFDPAHQHVKLIIDDPQKIKELCRIFQEMAPQVVAWPRGMLSCPAPSRLILKRKETLLLQPNEIAEWDLIGTENFSGTFIRLVTDMEFPGMERLGRGYLVDVSPEGLRKLNDFFKEEFQRKRRNGEVCVFESSPKKTMTAGENTH